MNSKYFTLLLMFKGVFDSVYLCVCVYSCNHNADMLTGTKHVIDL